MYKHGGMKLNLLTTDFKYIQDPTRIMWSQSVVKNMQKIVDLIANIPYRNFSYDGPIYYLIKIRIRINIKEGIRNRIKSCTNLN